MEIKDLENKLAVVYTPLDYFRDNSPDDIDIETFLGNLLKSDGLIRTIRFLRVVFNLGLTEARTLIRENAYLEYCLQHYRELRTASDIANNVLEFNDTTYRKQLLEVQNEIDNSEDDEDVPF